MHNYKSMNKIYLTLNISGAFYITVSWCPLLFF